MSDLEMPVRIQRKRTRGWKMPENTVYVGRPSHFGNPYDWRDCDPILSPLGARGVAVDLFRKHIEVLRPMIEEMRCYKANGIEWDVRRDGRKYLDYTLEREAIITIVLALEHGELRGKNVACWCSLDQPCHGDVLLEMGSR